MCLIEVWTFSECGCRFDHHVPCHPSFSRQSPPAKARHNQFQSVPTTPTQSRSTDDGDSTRSFYAGWQSQEAARQCSISKIEHKVFREPICDDCLLEELGLKKDAGVVQPSIEHGLDGEDWLLESKIEIQIDQEGVNPSDLADNMPTPRVGTGFDSLGDGDADDEGGLEDDFRGRSTRRSAIDINRTSLRLSSSWSKWDLKKSTGQRSEESHQRKKAARSLTRKMKDTELKTFAEKARRGLRLTIDRAKSTAGKARSDTSLSPKKNSWASESSGRHTPTLVTRVRSVIELRSGRKSDTSRDHKGPLPERGLATRTSESLTALPGYQKAIFSDYQRVLSAVSIPEQREDAEITTPTSISSSLAYEIDQPSPFKWEDHLRQDLGEREIKKACALPFLPGNKSDLHFDADDKGRRLHSTDTIQASAQIPSNISSGSWVARSDDRRLDEELAKDELSREDERRRSLWEIPDTARPRSSSISLRLPREVSTTEMDAAIPHTAKPFGHSHRPSTSSTITAVSHSPQTSPPRPSPRMRQRLSFHPLTTMLQIATPDRPKWSPRRSSFESPPMSSPYRLGMEKSAMERSPTTGFVCVHEHDRCAICGDGICEARVVSCICGTEECQAEKPLVNKVTAMEVCAMCSGQQ